MGDGLPAGELSLMWVPVTNQCSLQEMIGSYSMGEAIKGSGEQKISVSPPDRSPTASSATHILYTYYVREQCLLYGIVGVGGLFDLCSVLPLC